MGISWADSTARAGVTRGVESGAVAEQKLPTILVVSDGRGDTCAQVVRAALVQFEGQPCELEQHPNVRSVRGVERVVARAAAQRAVVFYTLVGDETRAALARAARRRLVPAVDVLGPGFSALHDLFRRRPRAQPGLLYASNRELFDRQEAIGYTLAHDDGQRLDGLAEADVVLVGVSRVSKSSTCFYLAYEGVKAANVPLVPGAPPPRELLRLPRRKVVGLRMNVRRLMTVREARGEHLGLRDGDSYLDEREIARELTEANRLMDRRGWRSLDVSYLAVEEIAREVRLLVGRSRRR
jgi:regulator of PEP synthase PpsR (kinase-PPPase family)